LGILVLGDAGVDIVIPYGEAKKKIEDSGGVYIPVAQLKSGGTSANTAYCISKLGQYPTFIAKIGNDGLGKILLDDLSEVEMDLSQMVVSDEFETFRVLNVVDNEERLFFLFGEGGMSKYAATNLEVDEVGDALDKCNILVISGAYLGCTPIQYTILECMRRAEKRGATIILDLNLRCAEYELPKDLIEMAKKYIDTATFITGTLKGEFLRIFKPLSIDEIADNLTNSGKALIVRDGGNDTVLYTVEGIKRIPAFPQEKIVDTIGAGDNFTGGFAVAISLGHSLEEACRWGNATASFSLLSAGGKGSPNMEQLKEILG